MSLVLYQWSPKWIREKDCTGVSSCFHWDVFLGSVSWEKGLTPAKRSSPCQVFILNHFLHLTGEKNKKKNKPSQNTELGYLLLLTDLSGVVGCLLRCWVGNWLVSSTWEPRHESGAVWLLECTGLNWMRYLCTLGNAQHLLQVLTKLFNAEWSYTVESTLWLTAVSCLLSPIQVSFFDLNRRLIYYDLSFQCKLPATASRGSRRGSLSRGR